MNTTTTFNDQMPHLNIEALSNGLIRLENESMGDSYTVDIHPVQLRYIAEKAGLLGEVTATDSDMLRTERGRIAEMNRDLDRYKRTLLAMRGRAAQLHDNIYSNSQKGHEDLGIEVAQSAALADMIELVCTEFEDEYTASPATAAPLQPLHPSGEPQKDPRQLALTV